MHQDTLIILPAHNEERHVAEVVRAARAAAPGAAAVVVDDGSRDATRERALEAGAIVLSLPINLGYGTALQTGYKYALRHGFTYAVQLDSDGQHDPAGIPLLLERVKSGACDVCVGSRFLEGSPYAIPFTRRMGMYLFRRVASRLIGQTITDPTSGFQAMNQRVLRFFSSEVYPVDYPDTDILVLLHRNRFRIAEAPVVMRAADTGKSIHAGLRPVYYLFKMALAIPLNLIRTEKTP